jgi:hypothetical protein
MRKHLLHISFVIATLFCLSPAWRLLAAPATTVVGNFCQSSRKLQSFLEDYIW